MNSLYAPGLKNKIVKLPSINSLITTSDGFAKKELSTYKLDIMGLCGFGCRYCSSNAGLGIKFRKQTFESASNDQLGRVISPHDDPSLTYEYFDLLPNLEGQLKRKSKEWGAGHTLVFSELTDGFSPNLVNKGITKYVLKQVLDRTSFRVRVLTKNACVGSDEWIKFFDKYWDRVIVGLSTGNIDEDWTQTVELGTSLPSKRFKAIQNLQNAGINTFGMLCPVFPDIVKDNRVDELVEMINPENVETVWAEPYNDRENWKVVQSGFQPNTYLYNWFEDEYEKKLGIWSNYATELYVQLYEHAEKNGWIIKLKYLLYENKINAIDAEKFSGLVGVLLQNKSGDDGFSKNKHIAELQKNTL